MYSGYPAVPAYTGPPPNHFNDTHASGSTPGWQRYQQSGYPPQNQGYPADPSSSTLPPSIASDHDAFAGMYNSHLASLTFNSKPIITNLTVMAHEHVQQMANVIARCIDEHIVQAPPPHRLPALYVLDSISKNIGPPYTTLWSQRIAHLFLETYRIVDQQTKMRMEELLGTWRTGGPGGVPLFGGDAQWAIERSIYGSTGVPGGPPPIRPLPALRLSPPPAHAQRATLSPVPPHRTVEASRAIEQIDRLVALMSLDQQRKLPSFNPQRMAALKQLRNVVATASLSPQEMSQIHTQLNALAVEFKRDRGGSSTPTLPSAPLPAPQSAQILPYDRSTPTSSSTPLPANLSAALASLTRQGLIGGQPQSGGEHPLSNGTPPPQPQPQEHTATASGEDLMRSLIAAGLVPAGRGSAADLKPSRQDDAYTSAILSIDIKLTSLDLQKELTVDLVDLVGPKYLPLQCRQCANRYPEGGSGQKSLDGHLDWHFRQGRRAKDSAARGLSRCWFDVASEWLRGGQDDSLTSSSSSSSNNNNNGLNGINALSAQQEVELKEAQQMWVVAPTSSDRANEPCPICKEKFTSEWSEEEEEWIWRNARKVDEEIYHGSCYYSAKVLSVNVVAQQQRGTGTPSGGGGGGGRASSMEMMRRSRTRTPESAPNRSSTTTTSTTTVSSANPVDRVKNEEAVDGGGGGGAVSKKRKEGPSSLSMDQETTESTNQQEEGGAGAGGKGEGITEVGEPANKKVALESGHDHL